MNHAERERLTEKWLDAALQPEADAEPRPGLETRILANLAAERQQSAVPWWQRAFRLPVAFGTAAVAVTLLVIAFTVSRSEHDSPPRVANVPTVDSRAATTSATTGAATVTPPEGTASLQKPLMTRHEHTFQTSSRRVRPSATTRMAPQMAQFPAPKPLSDQEKLLLRYLQRTPSTEVVAVATEDQQYREDRVREMEALLRAPEK